MSEQLTVIARMQAKAGQELRLRQELRSLLAPTRAETGCISYDLHESSTEPGHFMFYEVWNTEADLNAHFQAPHMQAISKLLPELREGPRELTKWTKL